MKKLLSLLAVALGFSAHAQITSTFDTDADGWTFLNSTSSSPGTFNPSGGNPGGFVSFTYASNTSSTPQHWVAPAKFLGNQVVRSLGMTFSFSLQQSQAGTSSSTAGDLRIEGGARGTIALVYSLPAKPAVTPAWSTYTVTLDETFPWRINSTTGPIATRTQIIEVLTRITAIEIRGTYASNATYTSGLDHVVLTQRTLLIAPTINSFSPTVGQPGSTITITGSQFDTNPTNNRVLLGGLRATVTAATPTQLTVTVPVGVATGFVSVTNLTTGLSARSNDRFVATFANGGRIITASFRPRVDIATAARSTGLRVGDMDDDGWPDLLMRYNLSGNPQVDIYRNLGTGGTLSAASFAPAFGVSAVSGGGTTALGLEVIDLDGDGKLDLITNGYIGINGFFYTYRNTSTAGNLSFETAETWEGLSALIEFPVFGAADLDGDGRPEMMGGLTASGGFPPDFWILPNISSPGNIEFGDAIDFSFSGTIDGASFAVPVDLNTDGKLDLVVSGSSYFVVLTNTSTPGRLSFTVAFSYLKGTTNSSLGVEDINQDGRKDIFWKNGSANNDIVVLLNQDTDGIITSSDFPTQIPIDGDVSTGGSVSVGDVNGDGRLEFLATNNSNIGVFENRFEGGALAANTFVAPYLLPGGTAAGPTAPTVADLNRDGRPDLVVPLGVNRISLFENQNVAAPEIAVNTVSPLQGPVGSTVTITGRNFSPTPSENEVWFGSVRAPVVSATPNEIRVTVPPGAAYAPVSVRKGELASRYHLPFSTTFSAGVSFDNTHFAPPTPFTLAGANYDIEVGDLDLDGKPDVIAEGNALVTSFFRNTHTTGGISTATLTAAGATSSSAANAKLVDVDGDGRLDIVGINGRTYPNQSTLGVISFGSDFITGDGSNLDFADFNLDGKFDIARTSPLGFGSNLRINENQGTVGMFVNAGMFGTFGSNISFAKPAEGGGIAATDLDNDGFPDIVVTNPGSDNISIFPNTQGLRVNASSFTSRQDIPVGDNPSRIYYGDFDRDAKNDLLLYHGAGTSATVLILLHNTSSPGNISFNRIDLTNPSATTVAHIADLDGDGKPEIITVSETGNRFSIFKNLHTSGALTAASFAAPFNTTVTAPRGLTTGDLNLDGKPEIILTRAAGFLLVYENLIPNPIITIPTQPVGGTFCNNAAAVLTLAATGTTNINYQWQRFDTVLSSFVNLVESSGYAGVATPVLSINLPFGANAGDFRCVVNGDLASPVFSNTVTVVAVAPPPPPVGTGASVCAGSPATLTASGGSPGQYRWYTVATGGTAIAGETNATYTTPALTASTDFFVAINNGTCESARTVVTATINTTPTAPTTTGATRCGTGTVTLSATGGAAGQYRWYTVATGGTAIAGETNATYTTPALTASTDFFVAINNGTCESARTVVTATINATPAAPTTTGAARCGTGTVTLSATGGAAGQYRWYTVATGGTAIAGETNATYTTPALTASTDFFVAINNGTCESARSVVTATINATPAAPTTTGAPRCGTGTVTLSATGGAAGQYRWYTVATGGTAIAGETNATYTTPALTASTDFFVAIDNGTCESTRSAVTATINPVPAKPTVSASGPLSFCSGQSVTLAAPAGFTYLWSNNATTQQITVSSAGSFTVVVSNANCSSVPSDPAVVTVNTCTTNQPPVIITTSSQSPINGTATISLAALLSDPDNNLDLATLRIVTPPRSGAQASIGQGNLLTVNYQGVNFSGTDELTIEVCDLAGLCVQQRITIEVVGDILVYNGLSPNGDGQNDAWIIEYINLVPDARENEVTIYNRWGDVVWTGTNYDNSSVVFRGLNRNGSELPSGTYFYKIQFTSARSAVTGFLALRK